MCAIAGILDLYVDKAICDRMLRTMARRGPDGNGVYQAGTCTLLHSRLAIIDPEGGKQPMVCAWKGNVYAIVYNGELYNTKEVRFELQNAGHVFSTASDTEVVLRAFVQWGEASLQVLNGIFAFAVWNETDSRLFIARDRMGVKPFFYSLHNRGLLFASEMKTILTYPGMEARLDAEGAAQLLLLGPGRMPGSGVFQNVFELKPACYGWYEGGRLTTHRYWKLTDRIHTDSFEETAENVRYLVTDAIRRQMVSDVPIGTFLSGGLDSSLISAVCSQHLSETGDRLNTFSLDYRDNDKYFKPGKFQPNADTGFIHIMEGYLKPVAHHTVLTPEQLIDNLNPATYARDLPGMADVDFSLLAFCGDIRNHVKVALSGECADEIFGGYPWYRDPAVRDSDGFPWAQNTAQRASILHPWVTERIDPKEYVYSAYQNTLEQADILPENSALERRMKQMVNLNYYWFMQTLLDRKDRMSMYNGLEVRVPFCDYRIAEYMYAVPWHYKDYNGYEKGLLRQAMDGILPEQILWRKKSPYPKTHDPKYLQLVLKLFNNMLLDRDAPVRQLVQEEALQRLPDQEMNWPWYGQLMQLPQTLAFLLQINQWLKAYRVRIV